MTHFKTEFISCPQCNHRTAFKFYSIINAQQNNELLQKIVDMELFKYTCLNCEHQVLVDYPLFYMNPTKNIIIKYYPTRKGHHSIYGNQFIDSELSDMDGIKIRLVTNLEAFIEKVQIFEEGLDDRAVELMKFIESPDEDSDIQFTYDQAVFTKVGPNNYQFMFMNKNDVVASLDFSKELYGDLANEFSLFDSHGFIINQNWAEQYVRTH